MGRAQLTGLNLKASGERGAGRLENHNSGMVAGLEASGVALGDCAVRLIESPFRLERARDGRSTARGTSGARVNGARVLAIKALPGYLTLIELSAVLAKFSICVKMEGSES